MYLSVCLILKLSNYSVYVHVFIYLYSYLKTQKYHNIKCLIMEYKRSTFQFGLQARNVNKSEKNPNNGSSCIVHLKTG